MNKCIWIIATRKNIIAYKLLLEYNRIYLHRVEFIHFSVTEVKPLRIEIVKFPSWIILLYSNKSL